MGTNESGPTDLAVRTSKAGLKMNDPHHKISSCESGSDNNCRNSTVGNSKFPVRSKRRSQSEKVEKILVDKSNEWEPCMFGTEGYEKTVIDMDYCRVWAPILV